MNVYLEVNIPRFDGFIHIWSRLSFDVFLHVCFLRSIFNLAEQHTHSDTLFFIIIVTAVLYCILNGVIHSSLPRKMFIWTKRFWKTKSSSSRVDFRAQNKSSEKGTYHSATESVVADTERNLKLRILAFIKLITVISIMIYMKILSKKKVAKHTHTASAKV